MHTKLLGCVPILEGLPKIILVSYKSCSLKITVCCSHKIMFEKYMCKGPSSGLKEARVK